MAVAPVAARPLPRTPSRVYASLRGHSTLIPSPNRKPPAGGSSVLVVRASPVRRLPHTHDCGLVDVLALGDAACAHPGVEGSEDSLVARQRLLQPHLSGTLAFCSLLRARVPSAARSLARDPRWSVPAAGAPLSAVAQHGLERVGQLRGREGVRVQDIDLGVEPVGVPGNVTIAVRGHAGVAHQGAEDVGVPADVGSGDDWPPPAARDVLAQLGQGVGLRPEPSGVIVLVHGVRDEDTG